MSPRLILAVIGSTALFLAGCETTSSTRSSLSEAEFQKLGSETRALINASGGTSETVKASRMKPHNLAGIDEVKGFVDQDTSRYSARAELARDGVLKVEVTRRRTSIWKTLLASGKMTQRAPALFTYLTVYPAIPLASVVGATVSKVPEAPSDLQKEIARKYPVFTNVEKDATETTKGCYKVTILLSKSIRSENFSSHSHRELERLRAISVKNADIAYFDKLADAEHLAVTLRKLAGIR